MGTTYSIIRRLSERSHDDHAPPPPYHQYPHLGYYPTLPPPPQYDQHMFYPTPPHSHAGYYPTPPHAGYYPTHPPHPPPPDPQYDQHRYYPTPPYLGHYTTPHPHPYGHRRMVPPQPQPQPQPEPEPQPYVEHQKTTTISNDVNLDKKSLRIVLDQENPGKSLVSFTFGATVSGSINIVFFSKANDCSLIPVKKNILQPKPVQFQKGLGQKFQQPFGTGIDLSMFEEAELVNVGDKEVYPLSIKVEPFLNDDDLSGTCDHKTGYKSSQITQAVFEKKDGVYDIRVVKQLLCVQGNQYELQEIYGLRNLIGDDSNENGPGKECVICLSEPTDTTLFPCRHTCMCSGCARVLRSQTNRCPICRQPVKRFTQIKINNNNNNYNETGQIICT